MSLKINRWQKGHAFPSSFAALFWDVTSAIHSLESSIPIKVNFMVLITLFKINHIKSK